MRAWMLLVIGLAGAGLPSGADTARAGTLTTLFKFGQDGAKACNPVLSFVAGGQLLGTAPLGGTKMYGLLFGLDPKTGTLTHLHDFSGHLDGRNRSGAVLYNGLVYGVTNQTPMPSHGNVYSVDPATGAFTVVHVFKQYQKGVLPGGNMIVVDGLLYGGMIYGGVPNHGGVSTSIP